MIAVSFQNWSELFGFLLGMLGAGTLIAIFVVRTVNRWRSGGKNLRDPAIDEFVADSDHSAGVDESDVQLTADSAPLRDVAVGLFAPAPVEISAPYDKKWDGHNDRQPPDWIARRAVVLARDGNQCQVTGCLGYTGLDVHHRTPVCDEGNHHVDNLVSLCKFHHFFVDADHDLVAVRIDDTRFSAVVPYHRKGFPVKAHVQRRTRASIKDLQAIRAKFGLVCRCGGDAFLMRRYQTSKQLRIACSGCWAGWILPWGLAEEIGQQLASILTVTRNEGKFSPSSLTRMDMAAPVRVHLCKECSSGTSAVSLTVRRSIFGRFWGCKNWNGDSTHFKQKWTDGDDIVAKELSKLVD